MVAHHPNFDLSEEMLRNRFQTLQPEIRERIELSCSAKAGAPDASVDSAVEQAYNLFVQLAKRGSVDLAYPTPLALAALRLDQQKRRSSE
jgi:hypothetical protein